MKKKHKHQHQEADVHMVEPETKELEGFPEPAPLEKPEIASDIDTPVQIQDATPVNGKLLYMTYVTVFRTNFNEGHHVTWEQLSKPVQDSWQEVLNIVESFGTAKVA